MRYRRQLDPKLDIQEEILKLRGIGDEFDRSLFLSHSEYTRDIFNKNRFDIFHKIRKGTLVIFGDYDVDGITAAAIANLYYPDAIVVIPERNQGYGLTQRSVNTVIQMNADSVLTVDCGIQSKEEVSHLRNRGVRNIVITDHHKIDTASLPDAEIFHPAIHATGLVRGEPNKFTGYSGAGVIYKLMTEVFGHDDRALQMAALGTICDMMPILDENRLIVRKGIEAIQMNPIAGIRALCEVAKIDHRFITEEDIGFYIGPMINACGRMGDARLAYKLMVSRNSADAQLFAEQAKLYNEERKKIIKELTADAEESLVYDGAIKVYVFDGMQEGMAGLLAGSISRDKACPVVVLSKQDELYSGSCRAAGSFSCYELIEQTRDVIASGGGHEGAAGLTVNRECLSAFLEEVKVLSERMGYTGETEFIADFLLDSSQIRAIIQPVLALRPFGNQFPAPTFLTVLTNYEVAPIGKEKNHTRIIQDGIEYLYFFAGKGHAKAMGDAPLEVAFKIGSERNAFTGRPSMIVEMIREKT